MATSRRRTSRKLARNSRRKGKALAYDVWSEQDPWAVTQERYTDPEERLTHLLRAAEVLQRKYPGLSAKQIAARLGMGGDKQIVDILESMQTGFLRPSERGYLRSIADLRAPMIVGTKHLWRNSRRRRASR